MGIYIGTNWSDFEWNGIENWPHKAQPEIKIDNVFLCRPAGYLHLKQYEKSKRMLSILGHIIKRIFGK